MTTASLTTMAGFVVEALPAASLNRLRAAVKDDFGNPLLVVTVDGESRGSPLRCCLREATPGEKIVLIAFRPRGGAGAYSEVGPIFIHAETCAGYRGRTGQYPEGFRHRQQVFRAYDSSGRIVDAVVAEGVNAETAISDLLSDPDVALVQSRNVGYGCFMFLVCRPTT